MQALQTSVQGQRRLRRRSASHSALNRTSTRRANTFHALLKTPKHDLAGGLSSPRHFSGLSSILEILIARLRAYRVQNTFRP